MTVDTMKVQVDGCQEDGFPSVGTQTGAIKLTMAGTDWWYSVPYAYTHMV